MNNKVTQAKTVLEKSNDSGLPSDIKKVNIMLCVVY